MRKEIVRIRWVVLTVLLALSSAPLAWGQAVASAQIHGVITDPSGAVIPKAQIKATQVATGMVRRTVSNTDGSYVLPDLPVGPYTIDVQATGFNRYVQSGIVLQVGNNVGLNVTLKVGQVSQSVVVKSNATMVQTQNTSMSEVVDQARIVNLPLNGRYATSLILLAGAAANSPVGGDFASSKNYPNSTDISVAGGQGNEGVFLLDGAVNNEGMTGTNLPYPFPDALQEFSVQSTGLSARYGLHPGEVVNVVTKSGTNQFHGDLFEFVRNGAFDARNYFAAAQDTLRQNQFGGTIGGPIKKNKLFFFFGYQGTRTRTSPPSTISYVETPAELNGDFSTEESAACQADHVAATLTNPATMQPFPDNQIPTSDFNQQALNLLKYVPTSSNPCGQLTYGIPTPDNENQYIGRGDWTISSKQTFFGRYFISNYSAPPFFNGTDLLTTTQYGNLMRDQSLVLGDTYTFSPTTLNTVHAAWTRLRDNRGAPTNDINLADLGVQATQPNPHFIQIDVNNFFDVGCGTCAPGYFNNNEWQLSDDVDSIHGRHHISFGVNWIHNNFNSVSLYEGDGYPTFTGDFTGSALADLFLGLPDTYLQGQEQQIYFRQNDIEAYAQDDVQVNSHINFHVGLRWEPYLPTTESQGWVSHFSLAAFQADTISKQFENAPAGMQYQEDGIPNGYTHGSLALFEPRVGAVWAPGNGKQTVRASYSIFYDTPETWYPDRFTDEAPYTDDISLTAPVGGFTNPFLDYPGGNPFPLPTPPTSTAYFPPEGIYVNMPLNVLPTYMQQWDLSYQRQLSLNWMVSATYIGNRTIHLWGEDEEDPAIYSASVCAMFTTGCTEANENQRRADYLINPTQGAKISTMAETWDGATSSFNGLVLSTQHRFSQHYTLLFNYTYSHCLSDADFNGELTGPAVQNPFDPNADYGNCGFDLRHNLVASLVAHTPKFSGLWENRLLGNWQLSPIVSYHSGYWFNPTTGTDNSRTGLGLDRPDLVGDVNPYVENTNTREWLTPAAYVPNAIGTFGNVGRDSVVGPGYFDIDAALVRLFPIREGQQLEVRFEAFNLGNNVNFNNPTSGLNSSKFGEITAANPERILQFALKYYF